MRSLAALGVVLAAALASPAFGQSLVGKWKATAHTQAGDFSETLEVARTDAGYSVKAKLLDAPPGTAEAGPGAEIVIDGDHFSYKRTVDTPNGSLKITYSGVVSGDSFTGTVDMGFAQVPYTGVRLAN
jgi:hypothetical protein